MAAERQRNPALQVFINCPFDEACSHVRDWLDAQRVGGALPGGKEISRRYRLFLRDLPVLLRRAHLDESEISKPEHFIDWSNLVLEWLASIAAS